METEKETPKQGDPFEKFPLKPDLIASLKKCFYTKPYHIQEKALLPMIQGRDVFIQSSCGSGKTSLAIITILQMIDPAAKEFQALILFPRRLEVTIAKEIAMKIGQRMDLRAATLVGGMSLEDQRKMMREGSSVLLGTPGRIFDFFEREELSFKQLRLIIVEDCDQILDLGYKEDIKKMLKFVPSDVQMCIFACSCSKEVREFNDFCLRNPVYISNF